MSTPNHCSPDGGSFSFPGISPGSVALKGGATRQGCPKEALVLANLTITPASRELLLTLQVAAWASPYNVQWRENITTVHRHALAASAPGFVPGLVCTVPAVRCGASSTTIFFLIFCTDHT